MLTVTDIYIRMRMEQSVASQHIAILRQVGILKARRSGKYVYYLIDYEVLDYITDIAQEMDDKITLNPPRKRR